MRIKIVEMALGNDALANDTFIIMIENGCCTMGPIYQSLGCFLDK